MKPLTTAAQIRALDQWTINELGLPGMVLMENAGRSMAGLIKDRFGPLEGLRTVIVCGRGNNGGDGFVIGRWLADWGAEVELFLLSGLDGLKGDALANARVAVGLNLDLTEVRTEEDLKPLERSLARAGLVVDALLGTGLSSEVRGRYARAIGLINASPAPVAAVDLPSGINADTGEVMGVAVRADLTVAFGAAKVGQAVHPGLDLCGELSVVGISIPGSAPGWEEIDHFELEEADLARFWPRLGPQDHKGKAGHLLVVAGSPGKTGAACLTAEGALRAGAGLVTVACPQGVHPVLEAKLTEAMTAPLSQTGAGAVSAEAIQDLGPLLQGKAALAVGPGLGEDPRTGQVLAWLLERVPLPAVVDADGLNLLAKNPESLKWSAETAVLTPHPGEMARLLKTTPDRIQADRLGAARKLAAESGQVVVLKGARTVVTGPDSRVFINPFGNPGLASGGSGDVLTGIIGALLAQGLPPLKAAQAGVVAHSLAADLLWSKTGGRGYLAGEVARALPRAVAPIISASSSTRTG